MKQLKNNPCLTESNLNTVPDLRGATLIVRPPLLKTAVILAYNYNHNIWTARPEEVLESEKDNYLSVYGLKVRTVNNLEQSEKWIVIPKTGKDIYSNGTGN